MPSYQEHLAPRVGPDGRLNDFLDMRAGRLIFAGAIDLLELVERYGTPLEISYCPLITRRVQAMHAHFAAARTRAGYGGSFVYAYATKANFVEEAVRTAITAGAHYETSSAFDVRIAHRLWKSGVLPPDRFVLCNGSKEPAYIDAILDLRTAGFTNVVPVLDDPLEFEALASCPEPLLLGLRERKDPGDLAEGITYGYDRFGMLPAELETLAARVATTHHRIILYHAMVGSQIEDLPFFLRELRESVAGYAKLRAHAEHLEYFDFGGGVPTGAYNLGFSFNYEAFAERLMREVAEESLAHGALIPHLVGEFGRYTVADHGVHLFRVGRVKRGQSGIPPWYGDGPPWYLVDGSLMVALPDILIVKGQQFIALPLNHMNQQAGVVVLGGRRTCDSDDFYPRTGDPPLIMPLLPPGDYADPDGLQIAFFGTGAYQAMLSGEGGAHHCLAPEAPKVIIEEQAGVLVTRVIGAQTWNDVLGELGY